MKEKTCGVKNILTQRQGIKANPGMGGLSFFLVSASFQNPVFFNLRETQMTKHYAPKIIDGQIWVVWRKLPELGEGSPIKKVQHYKSYLKASLVAYQENCRLTDIENEHEELFAGGVR